jgi:surface antigen
MRISCKRLRMSRRKVTLSVTTVVSVLAGMLVALTLAAPAHGTAGTNDYPYSSPTAWCATWTGQHDTPPTTPTASNCLTENSDQWAFYESECTSFVAWRLNNDNGFAFKNDFDGNGSLDFGNAGGWKTAAQGFGYTVDNTPQVGSVAWWGTTGSRPYGHVAWVEAVSGGNVTIEEYNYNYPAIGAYPHAYFSETIAANTVDGFIHFKDMGGRMMIIDYSNNSYAEDTLGNNWVQSSKVTGAKAIAVGGNRMMVINSADAAYASDSTGGGWTSETSNSGAKAIAAGSNGRQMIIDFSNNAYYEDTIGNSWQSPAQVSGAQAVALSNSRMMTINSSWTAYAKNVPSDSWQAITSVGGAKAIAVGTSGRMMIIDGSNHAYAEDTIANSWSAIMTSVTVTAIAVGGPTGRMLVLDNTGKVWFKEGSLSGSNPTVICDCGATAIAVGSSGRMMVIDANGMASGMDSLSTGWIGLTSNGGAKAIAVG